MRKNFGWLPIAVAVVVLGLLAVPVYAEEQATRQECMEKCRQAADLMVNEGVDEALKIIGDKNGPFVWKDTYVFCLDLERQCNAAHPVSPALVGKNLMTAKDVNGKMFFAEFISVAFNKGEGWVSYMWPKPGEQTASSKVAYVLKVPNQPYAVLAGIYN
ncbi:MAG: cache domain-containing protein [Desulfatibacillum sp.]|nr:cache domain-containing protein [Desulfatibacillum sp.]